MIPWIALTQVIFFFGVIGLFVYVTKQPKGKRKILLGKQRQWMMVGYVGILLLATGIYYLLPQPQAVNSEHSSNIPSLYEAVNENTVEDIPSAYIEKQSIYDYDKKNLEIKVNAQNEPNLMAIKRKETNDGKIDIIHYATPLLIEGIDVTEYTESPKTEVVDQALHVQYPDYIDLRFRAFQKAFTIVQFSEDEFWMNEEITRGEHLLYIEVPKDMDIDVDDFLDARFVEG